MSKNNTDQPWFAEKRAMAYVYALFAMKPSRIGRHRAMRETAERAILTRSDPLRRGSSGGFASTKTSCQRPMGGNGENGRNGGNGFLQGGG